MAVEFRVLPVPGGWMVEGPRDLAPLLVQSGGRAETKAEKLARAMTAAGVDARVVVFDRANRAVGSKWFPAWRESAGSPAECALAPA